MIQVVIVGAGGHASVVASALHQMTARDSSINVTGIVDSIFDPQNPKRVIDLPVIANDESIEVLARERVVTHYCLGIGSVKGGQDVRASLCTSFNALGLIPFSVIHPSAIIDPTSTIEAGTFIGPGTIINTNASIGAHAIINSGAIIEHDCVIGALAHIAPGTVLSGNCVVGEQTLVGTGSAVRHGIRIGANATIGAGSTVVNDVEAGCVVKGNPASR